MCPAWTGFSLEKGDTEAGFFLKVLGETRSDAVVLWCWDGTRGSNGYRAAHVHPVGFIPEGTHWVRDAGAACLMPISSENNCL